MKGISILLLLFSTYSLSFSQTYPDIHVFISYNSIPCDTLPRQVTFNIVDSSNICAPAYWIAVDDTIGMNYSVTLTLPLDTGWHSIYIADCVGGVSTTPFYIDCITTLIPSFAINSNIFSIFPNPAHDNIFIKTSDNKNLIMIELKDLLGNLLLRQRLINSQSIDISRFSKGVYILVVDNDGQIETKKIIKE